MIAAGLDPSLKSTGLCVLDTETRQAQTWSFTNAPVASSAELLALFDRVGAVLADRTVEVDLLAIEARGFAAPGPKAAHALSGLWWHLWRVSRPDLEVQPSQLKLYATGNGRASKELVLTNVIRRLPHVGPLASNDEADAVVLAHMVARLAGHPCDEMPKAHQAALGKLVLTE